MNATSLQELVRAEPWRRRIGEAKNALDPSWAPSVYDSYCPGDITFEGTSSWWTCGHCGYVGSGYTPVHQPPRHPTAIFAEGALRFMRSRQETTSLLTVVHQMFYVAGVALRHAASLPPAELERFIDSMVTR